MRHSLSVILSRKTRRCSLVRMRASLRTMRRMSWMMALHCGAGGRGAGRVCGRGGAGEAAAPSCGSSTELPAQCDIQAGRQRARRHSRLLPLPPLPPPPPPPHLVHVLHAHVEELEEAPLLALARDVEHHRLGEDGVGDDVHLALKGADEGAVPADVHHDALHGHRPLPRVEVDLVAHLKGVLRRAGRAGAASVAGTRLPPRWRTQRLELPGPAAPSRALPRPAAPSAPRTVVMMRKPLRMFSQISRPARPMARPPIPPMASTLETARGRGVGAGGALRRPRQQARCVAPGAPAAACMHDRRPGAQMAGQHSAVPRRAAHPPGPAPGCPG